jgi:beta-N-acetylhexosaminidase
LSGLSASSKAVIFGCSGTALTSQERTFFAAVNPFGFILFARNVETPDQVKALIRSLRETVGREAPVLIDQEGGRVARLKPPHWRAAPPAAVFAALAARDREMAREATWLNARLIGAELRALGIDVDCAPVADLPVPGAHDVIGDRAYGSDPEQVAFLARAAALGLIDAGVLPVIKHIPGHGRARADSHLELPTVETSRAELAASDFVPFRALADMPWAMTAHVLYTALDPDQPATTSPIVIGDIIRGEIGFDGVLVSDDLSMKALGGSFAERAMAALEAGCDLVLHCNGDFAEMEEIASVVSPLSETTQARLARAGQAGNSSLQDADRGKLMARLETLLALGRIVG